MRFFGKNLKLHVKKSFGELTGIIHEQIFIGIVDWKSSATRRLQQECNNDLKLLLKGRYKSYTEKLFITMFYFILKILKNIMNLEKIKV